MLEFTIEKFNDVKRDAEDFYNKIESVTCPFFKEKVLFNSKGFDHLVFKTWNKSRPINDQFGRLRHIRLAPEILNQSRTLQGVWTTQKMERTRKKDGKWQQIMKLVSYYEFIAVMESHGSKIIVKVIIKQVEGGEKFFLSLIPFWGSNKKGERLLHSGDPEND